jgi:hypothetical protein
MGPKAPARLLIALLCLSAIACSKSKQDQCVSIRRVIKTEMVATKEIAGKSDPTALKAHAELLKDTEKNLRTMEIEDEKLYKTVFTYLTAIKKLAESCEKPGDGTDRISYATILTAARKHIADVCNQP